MFNLVKRLSALVSPMVNYQKPLTFRCTSQYSARSHLCEEIGVKNKNEIITLAGWIQASRMDKFIILRDISGLCQINYDQADIAVKSCLSNLPNESVIECTGSIAQLHTKPQRNNKFKSFESELHVDWNGPNVPKAGPILEKALDRHFGSRKNWRFKTGSSKFITSKVVDRITRESSRLAFLE